MILDLHKLLNDWGKPKGVIHIGAQFLFARNFYANEGLFNTVWIEANPFFYDLASATIFNQYTHEKLFNYHIGFEAVNFSFTLNNDEITTTQINPITLPELIEQNSINILDYDFLHIGTQTVDIQLEAYGDLSNFKYISIEYIEDEKNTNSKYIDKILSNYRFKKVEKKQNDRLSHAFFVKKRNYLKK